MKRLLSIVLTIAMLMSMMSVPMMTSADAYPNLNLSSGFEADTSLGKNGSKTAVYGIAGKASTDESMMFTENQNTWTSWMYYEHGEEIYFDNGKPMTGYLVAELNFMAPDKQWLAEYFFGLSGNQARMTENVTSKIEIGKWNHIRMVYWADETNCDFKDYSDNIPDSTTDRLGAADVYVNGVKVGNTKKLTAVTNSSGTAFSAEISRILFEVYSGGQGKAEKHSVYMDDFKVYHSAEYPAAASTALAANSKYTVSGNVITIAQDQNLTAADIVAANAGYEVTAFSNASLTTEIPASSSLVYGNAVVVKSADNVYSYYDVADNNTKMLMRNDGELFATGDVNKLAQESVTGIAGKAATDKSLLFTALESHDGNIMISRGGLFTQNKNYLVVEANVAPVKGEINMASMSVHTTSHGSVSGAVGIDKFNYEQWNKYLMYVDFTGETPLSYTYLNGVKVIDGGKPSANLLKEKATIRLCFNSTAGQVFKTYIDDFKVYETNTLPNGVVSTAKPVPATNGNYTVDGTTLKILPGVTVGDIKSANTDMLVRVYKNAEMKEIISDASTMDTGSVAVFENTKQSLAMYDVKVSYGEVEIDLRNGDTKAFAEVYNAVNKGETVEGFAGKDASDKVLAVTPSTDTYTEFSKWGKATAKTDTAEATWDKANYNGYLVFEASIYNIDNDVIGVATTQTKPVSGNIAGYIPKNQWSRVKVVYNHKIGDENYGKARSYVDGVAVTDWTNTDLGKVTAYENTQYCNVLRLSLKGSKSGAVATYVDDIRIYETLQVRPDEAIAFGAVENAVFGEKSVGIVEGANVTVADLKGANATATIKVFNNKTDYTELADNAVLAKGNVVVAMDRTTNAADSNLAIKDIIKVMDVDVISATKDLALTVHRAAESSEEGVFGNSSSTIKKYANNMAENNWYFSHDSKGASAGMNYIVLETDFAPSSDITNIYLGCNQHSNLSMGLEPDKHLKANRWHKVVVVYDLAADTSDTYVDGELVSEDFAGCYKKKFEENKNTIQLRVVINAKDKTSFESYFDNLRLYEAINHPVIAEPAKFADGYNEAAYGFVDNVSGVISVKNGSKADFNIAGADVVVSDSNFDAVAANEELTTGDIVTIKKNGNFANYDVEVLDNDAIVVIGETYDAETDVMTPGAISIYGVPSVGAKLIVAQYDEEGNIIKIDENDVADDAGIIAMDFEPVDVDDTVVKAFLLEATAIKPLCKNKEISHTRSYNLLMLGNSFSMDVTCYMEEIAASMGKELNIGVLNKGGSAVSYHYTNREMPLGSSDIMFWLNDKTQGYSNLKTVLEKYDWDYVVFQNWGSSKSFYTNSDDNYKKNWYPMVNLAKYVKELEPNATQMIHETWSFESGYNDFKDIATRDAIGADIRALYSRCAEECADAIGQSEPLAKISSLDAFEAARRYTDANGVAKFETTYFVDGHKFIDYENRAKVPVGDGTMLLNAADAAAGKVSLHRDGFHASQAARYLIALNAVQFLTGKSILGNTYRPGEISLDSSAYYGGDEVTDLDNAKSGVIYQIYDPLTEDVVAMLQSIVADLK